MRLMSGLVSACLLGGQLSPKGGGMQHAKGSFEVKVLPQAADVAVGDPTVGRMALDKQFHGDLEGTSKGQMLTAMSEVKGSAGYVAMERVVGTLDGNKGSFALMHRGVMTRGTPELLVSVVPDSGTEELLGISGMMTIEIAHGAHSYDFAYELAGK